MPVLRLIAIFWRELVASRESLLASLLNDAFPDASGARPSGPQIDKLILAKRVTGLWMVLWSSVFPALLSVIAFLALVSPMLHRQPLPPLESLVWFAIASVAAFGVFYFLALLGLGVQGLLLRPFASLLNRYLAGTAHGADE